MHILYVYGTLRPGGKDTVLVPGQIFNLGWFPGIKTDLPGEVVCEKIEVEDIVRVDAYEGYREEDHEGSLYIRKPYLDGWIYEFNREVNPETLIESGDWLEERKRLEHARSF